MISREEQIPRSWVVCCARTAVLQLERTGSALLWKENDSAEVFSPPFGGWQGKRRGAGRLAGCQNGSTSDGACLVRWIVPLSGLSRQHVSQEETGHPPAPGTAVSRALPSRDGCRLTLLYSEWN